jgi:hypothetical protein
MKTIIRTLLLCALLFVPVAKASAQETGDIKVTVLDEKSEPMMGIIVQIIAGGPVMGGATDEQGIYIFRSLTPGSYDVQASKESYKKYIKTGIGVSAGQTSYSTFVMQLIECDTCPNVVTIKAVRSLVDPTFSTVDNLSAIDVKHNASDRGNVVSMVDGKSSQVSVGKGGKLVMRGARETASSIYVDGEVMYGGAGVCAGSIEQITVLSGGIPAAYGDLTGGAVIITTKSFYTGLSAKQAMYQEAADQKAAEEEAAAEKSGKKKVDGKQIIEHDTPVPAPIPVPVNDSIPQPTPRMH